MDNGDEFLLLKFSADFIRHLLGRNGDDHALVVQNLYYGKARFLLSVQNTILVFSVLGSLIGAQLLGSRTHLLQHLFNFRLSPFRHCSFSNFHLKQISSHLSPWME